MKDSPDIHVYDGRGDSKEIAFIGNIHSSPLVLLKVSQQELREGERERESSKWSCSFVLNLIETSLLFDNLLFFFLHSITASI